MTRGQKDQGKVGQGKFQENLWPFRVPALKTSHNESVKVLKIWFPDYIYLIQTFEIKYRECLRLKKQRI